MKFLLTGAFGNVGTSTLREMLKRNYDVRVFDVKTEKNKRRAYKFKRDVEIIWGDIRNYNDVEKAVSGIDIVIHVTEITPPLVDKNTKLAEAVNVGGTANIVKAMENQPKNPKLIFTSSVAVYGDLLENTLIRPEDPLNQNLDDEYAKQKIKCEEIIKNSSLDWAIFRLTYIPSLNKLHMDPLMFEIPFNTCIEICDVSHVGLALTNAVVCKEIWGEVMLIANGNYQKLMKNSQIYHLHGFFISVVNIMGNFQVLFQNGIGNTSTKKIIDLYKDKFLKNKQGYILDTIGHLKIYIHFFEMEEDNKLVITYIDKIENSMNYNDLFQLSKRFFKYINSNKSKTNIGQIWTRFFNISNVQGIVGIFMIDKSGFLHYLKSSS